MTTAKERYEAKTRVVTFRVRQELYDELKKIKVKSGLSFADLVKLGAGIARDEIEAKIAEKNDLQEKLENLRRAVQTERQKIKDIAKREKQEQLGKLENEIRVYRLFDLGWSIEEIRSKLGMSEAEASQYFNEWCTTKGEKEKIQDELLKKRLRKHIALLQEHILWRAYNKELEEAKGQLVHYQRMLIAPSKLTEEERNFLLVKYSYLV